MSKQRPTNLAIHTMALPITAYASILHRISAVAVWIGLVCYLAVLFYSLQSPENYQTVLNMLTENGLIQFFVWAFLTAMGYYACGGVKHLIQEAGHGEGIKSGAIISYVTIGLGVVLSIFAGVWLWA